MKLRNKFITYLLVRHCGEPALFSPTSHSRHIPKRPISLAGTCSPLHPARQFQPILTASSCIFSLILWLTDGPYTKAIGVAQSNKLAIRAICVPAKRRRKPATSNNTHNITFIVCYPNLKSACLFHSSSSSCYDPLRQASAIVLRDERVTGRQFQYEAVPCIKTNNRAPSSENIDSHTGITVIHKPQCKGTIVMVLKEDEVKHLM